MILTKKKSGKYLIVMVDGEIEASNMREFHDILFDTLNYSKANLPSILPAVRTACPGAAAVYRMRPEDAADALRERVLAFDGEREHVMAAWERFEATLDREGPRVVDVPAVLARAAARGALAKVLGNGRRPSR